ncbi:hypothetical protein HRR80_001893 [Exophiala dermatitidis]|uniref:Uncharacterized protein n=1 Tax=Exophiala dermatitidis TaxID=5970 RepID=A0AAN6IXP9_EXODE|nr:hypothetical protein HRR79_005171 [Exophiala dermatitidis]KAJ4580926.1 hypothetical protein HRR82_004585 [Exophiala dermatitidis]KAJ4624328.1 hypothetical protein HRR86_005589 [Exophiala dermatitidis]KAJ8995205.1 hypothetical protein HRR80_001893 [Exophiala dermatitidis]
MLVKENGIDDACQQQCCLIRIIVVTRRIDVHIAHIYFQRTPIHQGKSDILTHIIPKPCSENGFAWEFKSQSWNQTKCPKEVSIGIFFFCFRVSERHLTGVKLTRKNLV